MNLSNEELDRWSSLAISGCASLEGLNIPEQVKVCRKMLAKWAYIHQHGDTLYCANVKFWEDKE